MLTFARISLGNEPVGGTGLCALCAGRRTFARDVEDAVADVNCAGGLADGLCEGILFDGYEPFAHPNLVELIQQARTIGVERIALHTDGGALSRVDNARGSMDMGVRIFEISIFGATQEVHDRIAGIPGLFEAMSAGITQAHTIAQEAGYSITLIASLDVCKHNAAYFLDIVSFCLEKGFDAIRLRSGSENLTVELIEHAHALATTRGIVLFGEGITHLNNEQLYEVRAIEELQS